MQLFKRVPDSRVDEIGALFGGGDVELGAWGCAGCFLAAWTWWQRWTVSWTVVFDGGPKKGQCFTSGTFR